ncbi:hypothetical protein C8Q73DRAFT_528324 [Cubamyces lactineus]|nr:hypothetical protein C8Q73DRAFT_528324 [Cubamyces lactineus]
MNRPLMFGAYPSGRGSSYANQQGWPRHGSTEWTHQQALYPPASMSLSSYSGSAQRQQGAMDAQYVWGQPVMPSPAPDFGPNYSSPHPHISPHSHNATHTPTPAGGGYFAAPPTSNVDPSLHPASAVYTGYPPNPSLGTSFVERPHGMLLHATSNASLVERVSTASPIPVASNAAIAGGIPGSHTATPFSQASQAPLASTGVVPSGSIYDATDAPIPHSTEDPAARRMASVENSASSGGTVLMLGGVMEFDGKESRLTSDRGVNRAETSGDADSASKNSSENGHPSRRVTAPPAYSP